MTSTEKIQVLHITPHLGGGVGKALVSLVNGSHDLEITHSFLLLEKPQKKQFPDQLTSLGCKVRVCPDEEQISSLISRADIVQLEWWNHPATFQFLCTKDLPPMRLLVWCHQSGLYPPLIPPGLITISDRFIFTSPCSSGASNLLSLPDPEKKKMGVVSSGVGLPDPPAGREQFGSPLRACYVGTLSFSKLHPDFVQFLDAVSQPDFRVIMIGDPANGELLQQQCENANRPGLLDFTGFIPDILPALASADVLVYLLNPTHYGTAENALLEAMSAGVVPIVLNNPCEMAIVENGKTGIIVNNPVSFSGAIEWLSNHPDELQRLSRNASRHIRETYTPEKMAKAMAVNYRQTYSRNKRKIQFNDVLGSCPSDWFLACQRKPADNISEIEKKYSSFNRHDQTKGSIQHFLRYFPDDEKLKKMHGSSFG